MTDRTGFLQRQLAQIRSEGRVAFVRKLWKALRYALLGIPVVLFVIVMRVIRPWVLVRFGDFARFYIGHLSVSMELYVCERDAGAASSPQRQLDILYTEIAQVSNRQLERMWKRLVRVWPAWFVSPVVKVNRLLPGARLHEIDPPPHGDRDVHNRMDRSPPHLQFTADENAQGQAGLRAMGIPSGAPHVCIIVRDPSYNAVWQPLADDRTESYRNGDIRDFGLAAQELASRGYFVIRMGERVRDAMPVTDPRIIDYATNGMRSDFMDIYLGATCAFCVGSATGFTGVPQIFRRPVVTVDLVPLGYIESFWKNTLTLTKRHYSIAESRELTLSEIFSRGLGYCLSSEDYESRGVRLINSTPEDIRNATIEMAERVRGTWRPQADDEALQRRFWEIFPTRAVSVENNQPLHGEIRGRFSAAFLRDNPAWLQ